jgi:hypothetical protein
MLLLLLQLLGLLLTAPKSPCKTILSLSFSLVMNFSENLSCGLCRILDFVWCGCRT